MRNPTVGMLRSIFAFTGLLAVTVVHGQNANVVAATSVSNQIEQVTPAPPGGTVTVLNTDESSFQRIESLTFNNTGPTLNLLAADNLKHNVVQYTGDFSCTPLSACSTGSLVTNAVANPQGLSLDRAGDLYILNDAPGSSPMPAVYVLLTDTMGGFGSLKLIDNTNFGPHQALVESLIVGTPPSTGTDIGPNLKNGDLLVLATTPNALFRYQGSGATGPMPGAQQQILLAQCAINQTTACIPATEVPQGIAIWEDGTLLMSTQSGRILNYDCSGALPTPCTQLPSDFADISSGLVKIKVARQRGQMSAFVAQSTPGNHGSVIELTTVSGTIQVTATINTGGNTQGIAVTNTAQTLAANCQDVLNGQHVGGCDPLGGNGITVNRHDDIIDPNATNPLAGQLTGALVDDLCVAKDTRLTGNPPPLPACGNAPLLLNKICPGVDNTGQNLQIPPYMCAAGNGKLAIIRTKDNHQNYDQTLVSNAQDWDSLLPAPDGHGGSNNATCGPPNAHPGKQIALGGYGWTLGEYPLVGGVEDFNSGCDGPTPRGGNSSIYVIGAALDCYSNVLNSGPFANTPAAAGPPACLWNFEYIKYTNLLTTVANLNSGNGGSVPSAITQAEALLLTNGNTVPTNPQTPPPPGTPGCIDNSLSDFITATQLVPLSGSGSGLDPNGPTAYFQAATNLLTNAGFSNNAANNTTCDSIVTNNLGAFTEQLGGGPPNYNPAPILNPSGQVRARLANDEYTNATLILSNPSPASWPPPLTINASCPPTQSCPTTEQGGSAATTVNLLNGSVNATNGPLNLTWAVNGAIATGCTLTSDIPKQFQPPVSLSTLTQPLLIRPPHDNTYHKYTITCSVPDNTTVPPVGSPGSETISATAWAVAFKK